MITLNWIEILIKNQFEDFTEINISYYVLSKIDWVVWLREDVFSEIITQRIRMHTINIYYFTSTKIVNKFKRNNIDKFYLYWSLLFN